VFLLSGVVGVAWRRVRPFPLLATAGACTALVPVFFVVQTVISDHQLLTHLSEQQSQYNAIVGQFGYPAPRNLLTSVLIVPLSGPWQVVISALRPGWYLTLAGGLMLLVHGRHSLVAWARNAPRWSAVAIAVVAAVLLASIGRGVAANELVQSAGDALQIGDYSSALSRVVLAQHLNAGLQFDSRAALVRGQALASTGDQTSPLALLYIANLRDSVHDEIGALSALETAAADDPNNQVVIANLLDEALSLAKERQDPGILQGIVEKPYGDRLDQHYTLGRILYARSDFDLARIQMIDAAEESGADANVASSAHTYIALCEERLGQLATARGEVLTAIHLDTQYINSLARSVAAGLYISGTF